MLIADQWLFVGIDIPDVNTADPISKKKRRRTTDRWFSKGKGKEEKEMTSGKNESQLTTEDDDANGFLEVGPSSKTHKTLVQSSSSSSFLPTVTAIIYRRKDSDFMEVTAF